MCVSMVTVVLLLLAGLQTTSSASCQRELPGELIFDLWSLTRELVHSLPTEFRSDKRNRLLPKFCTSCTEFQVGWADIDQLIGVYQRVVFKNYVIVRLLPLHYPDLLHTLQHTLQHCVSSKPKYTKWSKKVKSFERKIKKMKTRGVIQAVSEFLFILRWTSELRHTHKPE